MFKIITVVGARPQIIKAAALSRAIKNHYSEKINEVIVHTGQHYDENMSQVFFDELGIPESDACSDTNAGAFHTAISNLVGIRKTSLVEDRAYDYEVWNQPVRGYKVMEQRTVTEQEGIAQAQLPQGFRKNQE